MNRTLTIGLLPDSRSRNAFFMPRAHQTTVGRRRELAELSVALEDAQVGAGSLLLCCGEPGIGKSRLAEELAETGGAYGFDVFWGRAWEAGGAPAYWPWIQVLRDLVKSCPSEALEPIYQARAAYLQQLVPELMAEATEDRSPSSLSPEQARFHLLDSVTTLICEAARVRPALMIFEDLHAADPSTVLLLDFASRQVGRASLVLFGTFREADARSTAVGDALQKLTMRARSLRLTRLDRRAVREYLEQRMGQAPSDSLVGAVFEATEGNPLFLQETVRLLLSRGAGNRADASNLVAVPSTVRTAIRERLAGLSDEARDLLGVASVMGREFPARAVAEALGCEPELLSEPLAEATGASIVSELAAGTYRFEHILMREVIHQDLPESRRSQLHLDRAERLKASAVGEPRWSEIAHHYVQGGPRGIEPGIDASVHAARRAREQLAFDEAVTFYAQALTLLEQLPAPDSIRRYELLLGRGSAELRAGRVDEGRSTCREAADLARSIGDPERFARAALEYGSVFVYAQVDPILVSLLEEAIGALGASRIELKARVMARLAAAQQPAADPRGPIARAHEAIRLARQTQDRPTLLAVIRAAASAMMDLAPPAERIELNREHVTLAESLGDEAESMRGHVRLSFDAFELGQLDEARSALFACDRLAAKLDHPAYTWQAAALHAMRCIWEGHFAEAERHAAEARALGERAGDPNAKSALTLQQRARLRLEGRFEELVELVPRIERVFAGSPEGEALGIVMAVDDLLHAGRRDKARQRLSASALQAALQMDDRTTLDALVTISEFLEDEELTRRLYAKLLSEQKRFVSGGVVSMTWEAPAACSIAGAARALGRFEEAERCYREALELATSAGARPYVAWIGFFLGCLYAEKLEDPDRARARLDQSLAVARELAMPGLVDRIEAVMASAGAAARPADGLASDTAPAGIAPPASERGAEVPGELSLQPQGEIWVLTGRGARLQLKDSKGIRMLAVLMENPGREFHVLDLSSPGRAGAAADGGDAGEMLDERARAEYRKRLLDLRDSVEEAESWNDVGRAERAREEIALLEKELSRAVGLGGRERRAGSAAERARVNVQRRIRDAIGRIEEQDRRLGRYLSRAVCTGTYCAYLPE